MVGAYSRRTVGDGIRGIGALCGALTSIPVFAAIPRSDRAGAACALFLSVLRDAEGQEFELNQSERAYGPAYLASGRRALRGAGIRTIRPLCLRGCWRHPSNDSRSNEAKTKKDTSAKVDLNLDFNRLVVGDG